MTANQNYDDDIDFELWDYGDTPKKPEPPKEPEKKKDSKKK